jgi:hypothetical protein
MWLTPFWNEGISATSFWCQVAALIPDMFCNFYLGKITKLLITQQPLKLEKNTHIFEILGMLGFLNVCLTKF